MISIDDEFNELNSRSEHFRRSRLIAYSNCEMIRDESLMQTLQG